MGDGPGVRRGRLNIHKWRIRRQFVLERDGRICWLCGRAGADTVDHRTPLAHGGSDEPDNLRAAHGSCNYGRRDRPPPVASPTRAW
jgi:5-methylcytosine-specific restriction endonuclease McrA